MRQSTFRILSIGLTLLTLVWASSSSLDAQMINVGTPFNTVSDSYFERMGVNFGFSLPGGRGNGSRIVGLNPLGQITPNLNFTQNGMGSAVPPFGNFDPNASARFGFANLNRGGGGFSLGFDFGKGNDRSITSTVPSVTVPNGFGGFIGDGTTRPFVTGVVPVIFSGNQIVPKYTPVPQQRYNGVTKALESGQLNLGGPPKERQPTYSGPVNYSNESSSAESSDIGVAAIKAQRKARLAAQQIAVDKLLDRATEHESAREFREARVCLREAIKLIEDETKKAQTKNRLKDLRGK